MTMFAEARAAKYEKAPAEQSSPPRLEEPELLSDIQEEGEPYWLWKGFLGCGFTTLLTALPKCGKTELLAHIIKSLGGPGEFLSYPTKKANILIITEEHKGHWARRRDRLGIGTNVRIWSKPFGGKPTWDEWFFLCRSLAERCKLEAVDLVIVDTLLNCTPITDMNDPGEASIALSPLFKVCDSGAAILVISHAKKAGGLEGTAILGSTAYAATFDILVELRRFKPDDREDTRRIVEVTGRWEDGPPSLVIDRPDHDEYVAVGATSDVRSEEPTKRGDRRKKERAAEEQQHQSKALSILSEECKKNGPLSMNRIEEATGLTRRQTEKAVGSLLIDGRVVGIKEVSLVGTSKRELTRYRPAF